MAFKTFRDGPKPLSGDAIEAYLTHGSVTICTSETRPTDPVEGMRIYETDTDQVLQWFPEGWWA